MDDGSTHTHKYTDKVLREKLNVLSLYQILISSDRYRLQVKNGSYYCLLTTIVHAYENKERDF